MPNEAQLNFLSYAISEFSKQFDREPSIFDLRAFLHIAENDKISFDELKEKLDSSANKLSKHLNFVLRGDVITSYNDNNEKDGFLRLTDAGRKLKGRLLKID